MREKIGVILVNYNGKQYNDKCIQSILNSTIRGQIKVIIVDNLSTDGSLEVLEEHWGSNEQIQIIPLKENCGFSRASNEGIRAAIKQGIENFLLLNNDTEIEPFTIEKMVESQEQTGAIVVPKVFYADRPGIIWCAGGEFSRIIKKPRQSGLNRPDSPEFQVSKYCDFANGCCLLLTKEIVDKIGFLDDRFFLYYEDTEYSFRAWENGIAVWYCADALVFHKVNGSTKGNEKPENAYYITRNWLLCNWLHMKGRFLLFVIYFLINRLAWIFIWTIQGKQDMVKALLAGVKDFCTHRYGRARKRNYDDEVGEK